jgi:hypothetical protein
MSGGSFCLGSEWRTLAPNGSVVKKPEKFKCISSEIDKYLIYLGLTI